VPQGKTGGGTIKGERGRGESARKNGKKKDGRVGVKGGKSNDPRGVKRVVVSTKKKKRHVVHDEGAGNKDNQ